MRRNREATRGVEARRKLAGDCLIMNKAVFACAEWMACS